MNETSASTSTPFETLDRETFMLLTTFRKDGTPMPTTVCFARDGHRLFVLTAPTTGKLKRIRATPNATMAPSDWQGNVHGPTIEGKARVLEIEDEQTAASRVLDNKYGSSPQFMQIKGTMGGQAQFIEITE